MAGKKGAIVGRLAYKEGFIKQVNILVIMGARLLIAGGENYKYGKREK